MEIFLFKGVHWSSIFVHWSSFGIQSSCIIQNSFTLFLYDEVRLLCSFTIKFVYYFSLFYDDYQNRTKWTNAKKSIHLSSTITKHRKPNNVFFFLHHSIPRMAFVFFFYSHFIVHVIET